MEAKLRPEDIYQPHVYEKGQSIFGKTDRKVHYQELVLGPPLLRAFWEDNDIQEITIVSTNIGMVKTFTKEYLPWKEEDKRPPTGDSNPPTSD